ncbi:MAG: hypothetical protein ACRC33_11270 [Gemmataceae bacterium]
MEKRLAGLKEAGHRIPRGLVLIMSSLAFPEPLTPRRTMRRIALRATRPALNDLRFRGEADVTAEGDGATVCIGTYELTRVACTPLDIASLSRTFSDIRTGQARRNIARK